MRTDLDMNSRLEKLPLAMPMAEHGTLADQVGSAVVRPNRQVKNCKTGAMSRHRDSSERRQFQFNGNPNA